MITKTSKKESQLPRLLSRTDIFFIALGSTIGVGWITVLDSWYLAGGPLGSSIAFLTAPIFLIPILFVYSNFGSTRNDVMAEMGFVKDILPVPFAPLVCWLALGAALLICTFEALSIGRIVSVLLRISGPGVTGAEVNHLESDIEIPAGVVAALIVAMANYRSTRLSAVWSKAAMYLVFLIALVFIVIATVSGNFDNLMPMFGSSSENLSAVGAALAVWRFVPFFITGFESIPKLAADTKIDSKPRLSTYFLVILIGSAFYVVICLSVGIMAPWVANMPDSSLPLQYLPINSLLNLQFGRLVSVGVLLVVLASLLKVFNNYFMQSTRMIMALGEVQLLPSACSSISGKTLTPYVACMVAGLVVLSSLALKRQALVALVDFGSLVTCVIWGVVSVAHVVKYFRLNKIAMCMVGILSMLVAGLCTYIILESVLSQSHSFRESLLMKVVPVVWLVVGGGFYVLSKSRLRKRDTLN